MVRTGTFSFWVHICSDLSVSVSIHVHSTWVVVPITIIDPMFVLLHYNLRIVRSVVCGMENGTLHHGSKDNPNYDSRQ